MTAHSSTKPSPRRPLLDREFALDMRRRKVAAPVSEICHEFGAGALTVTTICNLARMSRVTFYKLFTSVDDSFSFAVEDAYTRLFAPLLDADLAGPWLRRVEAALEALFQRLATDPLSAELYLVHSFRPSSDVTRIGSWRGAEDLGRLLASGREEALLGRALAVTADEFWASATLATAAAAIRRGEADLLPEQVGPLTRLIGECYLGPSRVAQALASAPGK